MEEAATRILKQYSSPRSKKLDTGHEPFAKTGGDIAPRTSQCWIRFLRILRIPTLNWQAICSHLGVGLQAAYHTAWLQEEQ